jgi:IS30 family transposase
MPALSDDDLAEIRRLHAAGESLGGIARALGKAKTTVGRAARAAGLSFERSRTEAAVKAHSVDMAARRHALAENLLADAERIREQMWTPTTVYNFGGKDNEYNERTFDEAPADIKRTLMQTVTTAAAAHLRLVDHAAKDSHDDARDVVLQFGIAVRAAQLPDDEPPG